MSYVNAPVPLIDQVGEKDLYNEAVDGLKYSRKIDAINSWRLDNYYDKMIPRNFAKEKKMKSSLDYIYDTKTYINAIQFGDRDIPVDVQEGMLGYRPGDNELIDSNLIKEVPSDAKNRFNINYIVNELDTDRFGSLDINVEQLYKDTPISSYYYSKRSEVSGFPDKTSSNRLKGIY